VLNKLCGADGKLQERIWEVKAKKSKAKSKKRVCLLVFLLSSLQNRGSKGSRSKYINVRPPVNKVRKQQYIPERRLVRTVADERRMLD